MFKKLMLLSLSSVAFLVGCGSKSTTDNTSDSQGIATRSPSPSTLLPEFKKYVTDPQLVSLYEAEEASFWIYTKNFNSEGSPAEDINVCFYAAKTQRSQSAPLKDPKDRTRFVNSAKVLKGGKYISWNKFFTIMSGIVDQKSTDAVGRMVSNRDAVGMKEMRDALQRERKAIVRGVDVLETMQVLSTLKGGFVSSDSTTLHYGEFVSTADKNASAQAAVLIALQKVATTGSACPSKETVSKIIR
jgi:hypothetical protein